MPNQKSLYNSKKIYDDYARRDYLEKPEIVILDELFCKLPDMDMLDMGVGGGRTTLYFAPLVKSYIGADYAPQMVKICREKFKDKYKFIESDVRSMNEFEDNSFDFILFSFNGIDSFGHQDRQKALNEIRRVLKNNGYFCFSSHNLNWKNLNNLFSFRLNDYNNKNIYRIKNPVKRKIYIFKTKYRAFRLAMLNKSFKMSDLIVRLRKKDYGHIYDNSLNGKAKIYYISYQEQLRQLKRAGFMEISSYSRNGLKTTDEKELNSGGWIYYLCKADKKV
ncbi:MAG: class I SAM-dependent methyltransferase [Actinobacteria bacterium]|nr:class I SAM-dependent methyltransferase [Actinomycetota bacterium]MCL5069885.1 class I SAM-dependent methyltransferase [Actinomycetota bacterium]